MYGPAVRCKRFRRSGFLVLHQCIRPRIGASLVLRAAMDISARSISLADRPRIGGPKGSPVFDRAGKTVLHLVSISRRPRPGKGCDVMSSLAPHRCSSFVRAMRPFLRPGLRLRSGRRAQGPLRLAVALVSPRASAFPGHAFTAPSTVPRFKQLGTPSYSSWCIRICVPC